MRIAVVTKDAYLYQKIRLTLGEDTVEKVAGDKFTDGYDLYLVDTARLGVDCAEQYRRLPTSSDRASAFRIVYMGDGGDLPLPFTFEALCDAAGGKGTKKAELVCGDKCAYLRGRKIALTDVEFSLFYALYSAGGNFVSREELMHKVWGPNDGDGVLNVYIHYLRQKLEDSEKIIISSRKNGYKIDERYIRGEVGEDA